MFSGIGGFEYGIQEAYNNRKLLQGERRKGVRGKRASVEGRQAGATCIGFSEVDKYAISIYKRHYPEHKNYGDATTINVQQLPDFDLLVGGFPCQAFSVAGKRKGFMDTRGTLFFEISRILEYKRPRYFVLENVPGLLSHEGGKTFSTILRVLSDIGYRVEWQVLNSKDYGVPQNRERIFIVGCLREYGRPQVFPAYFPNREDGDKGREEQEGGQTVSTLDTRYGQRWSTETYVQEQGIRRLTPTECERLQGFPDGWTEYGEGDVKISDTQRYKCCGNAVTTNVITRIFMEILKTPTGG